MRLFLVTDAWKPQVNGVVRTLGRMIQEMEARGHVVEVAAPSDFHNMACPTYPEIRLALLAKRKLVQRIEAFRPDAIHLATEGPLGMAARGYCMARGYPYTTAYHTRFPEYVHARVRLPLTWSYALLRRFHNGGARCMVSTQTIQSDLESRGFRNIARWSRGVDTKLFRPRDEAYFDFPRPISLYAGRVAVEKNVPAFLDLDLPGTKIVAGDGPILAKLKASYPDVVFLGSLDDEALARAYAAADVFVFPSKTDTFGLVMLEALASGTPVAGFPVPGPLDVVGDRPVGSLDEDLSLAVGRALDCSRDTCRDYALGYDWDVCVTQFVNNLEVFPSSKAA
ncbi:MAG: glycosyltransferase family 1 protein [Alphaproteobacteria bacterium]|nr:glycosyltransferase family 1 protein [Alphaproteobacteria bacterium]